MLGWNLGLEVVAIHPDSGEIPRRPMEKSRRLVITGLDPVIHLLRKMLLCRRRWIRGSSPRMTAYHSSLLPPQRAAPMQTLHVNGYDMAYLEIGRGPPLVCVHGTLGDFRTWYAVLGPLSKKHRVISVSLRHFFPEHWDGVGNDYLMSQHVADVIAFIEQIDPKPVDLMGHSRGGHIAFRVAEQRPDLLRKMVLAEPGGGLDASFGSASAASGLTPVAARMPIAAEKVRHGD